MTRAGKKRDRVYRFEKMEFVGKAVAIISNQKNNGIDFFATNLIHSSVSKIAICTSGSPYYNEHAFFKPRTITMNRNFLCLFNYAEFFMYKHHSLGTIG